MKFWIKHEIHGRVRVHLAMKRCSLEQADTLQYYLEQLEQVTRAKVYQETADVTIYFEEDRETVLTALQAFSWETAVLPEKVAQASSRALNAEYKEKLVMHIFWHYARRLFLPAPIHAVITVAKSVPFLYEGIKTLAKGKLEVSVLDATAIGVSIAQGNLSTAGSVMFLLGVGELLEEWTHKKSVVDLARGMSLHVEQVWQKTEDGQQVLVPIHQIQKGDQVVVHMGNVIPFDATVAEGDGMVNEASFTGEAAAVHKTKDSVVYAGTVLEEGELTLQVEQTGGDTRYQKIVAMIEDSEQLKSNLEGKASRLADRLVPYTLLGTGLTWLLTGNATKAVSVLMVDFSCALKLSMPLAVLSAMKEAGTHQIVVKGGKFLEAVAESTTIVFDKTGTLTQAKPEVREVIAFSGRDTNEMLRVAACLEEHFPHSMAKAVVQKAVELHLEHEEMHSKVDYIVAHGISSYIGEEKVIIGSYHFVFEDEGCIVPEGEAWKLKQLPGDCSYLYLAIEQVLAAVICICDPLRPEAEAVIRALRQEGLERIVMLTGDSERTASVIAQKLGITQYRSEVLPEDKAQFVEAEKAAGRSVIMIGDGINDSPALSAANVGIAISDGAQMAREIADITVAGKDLWEIVTLRRLSKALMHRIGRNYRLIIGINAGLIAGGVIGVLAPGTSALLHNASTVAISLESMKNLL